MAKRRLKVGDVVKYTKTARTALGYRAKEYNDHIEKRCKKYIGNRGYIEKVSTTQGIVTYAVIPINKNNPLPKYAWYEEEELDFVCEDPRLGYM